MAAPGDRRRPSEHERECERALKRIAITVDTLLLRALGVAEDKYLENSEPIAREDVAAFLKASESTAPGEMLVYTNGQGRLSALSELHGGPCQGN